MSRPERVVAADNEVQELVAKARKAQAVYEAFSQEQVDGIVRDMAKYVYDNAEQLARRSVEPSTLSLLGLLRHMAEVERKWFRQRFAGQDVPNRYQSELEPDGDFDGAVADQAVVDEAWAAWREEVAFAEQFVHDKDLDLVGRDGAGEPISLRELLVHMIEEYARHNGHADLIRERIDGRIGQ